MTPFLHATQEKTMTPSQTLLGCGLLLCALAPAWAETAAEAETETLCPGRGDLGVGEPLEGEGVLGTHRVCDVAGVEIVGRKPDADLLLFGLVLFLVGGSRRRRQEDREKKKKMCRSDEQRAPHDPKV